MKDEHFKGILNTYIKWPLYLSALSVAMLMAVAIYKNQALLIVAGFTVVYCIIALILFNVHKQELLTSLMDYAVNYGVVQKEMLKHFDMPYAILDETGRLIWHNEAFGQLFSVEGSFRWSIVNDDTGITQEQLPTGADPVEFTFSLDERDYRAKVRRINLVHEENHLIDPDKFDGSVITLVMYDETEINEYKRINRESSMVAGYIYLDNYDEALEQEDNVRASLLLASVDREINRYITKHDGIAKKTEPDKYFVVIKQKGLDEIIEGKFSILKKIKDFNYGLPITISLSLGFGLGNGDFGRSAAYAKSAMDMALSRGGDQAVVKDEKDMHYFGGNSEQGENNSRVYARRVAQNVKEHIENYEQVIVMGHSMADQDAFGSCVGIYCICRALKKKCYIVVNQVTTSIKPMLADYKRVDESDDGILVNSDEAVELVTPETLLIVVDTSRPDLCECPQLVELCKSVIIIDHHRQGSEKIENPLYQYIESNASSACEMITELLQYIADGIKPRNHEADCLYSGIMIDSGNFTTKTSARTFEAAAYLRKNGADVTRIRKMFRDSIESYKARAEAVRSAELFKNEFAIATCPTEGLESPTVVGAQAANELMNIKGVRASFVLTEYRDRIYISARSIDEINVQFIMERMGGGGHLNIAGAQLKDTTLEEARASLKETISSMIEKGEV